jgi:hypothetical protein
MMHPYHYHTYHNYSGKFSWGVLEFLLGMYRQGEINISAFIMTLYEAKFNDC